MSFTTLCFFESTYNLALDNIAGMTDTKYQVTGDDIRVPKDYNKLIAAYVVGATMTRAQLKSPSINKRAPLELAPIDATAEPVSRPPLIKMIDNPFTLDSGEALNALTTNTATAGDDQSILVWLANSKITPIKDSSEFPVRATGTTTLTADAWSNVSLTLDQDLEVGTYEILGVKIIGATVLAARLIFSKDEMRPGVIGSDVITDIDEEVFRHGNLGVWGEFEHDTPPKLEVYAAAGDTAQTVIFDVRKKGA